MENSPIFFWGGRVHITLIIGWDCPPQSSSVIYAPALMYHFTVSLVIENPAFLFYRNGKAMFFSFILASILQLISVLILEEWAHCSASRFKGRAYQCSARAAEAWCSGRCSHRSENNLLHYFNNYLIAMYMHTHWKFADLRCKGC